MTARSPRGMRGRSRQTIPKLTRQLRGTNPSTYQGVVACEATWNGSIFPPAPIELIIGVFDFSAACMKKSSMFRIFMIEG